MHCFKFQSPDGGGRIVLKDYSKKRVVQVDGATGKQWTRTEEWQHGDIKGVTSSMIAVRSLDGFVLTLVTRTAYNQVGPALVTGHTR